MSDVEYMEKMRNFREGLAVDPGPTGQKAIDNTAYEEKMVMMRFGVEPQQAPATEKWEYESEEQRQFAADHPNLYAASKVTWDILGGIEKVMQTAYPSTPEEWAKQGESISNLAQGITRELPYIKYVYPEQRAEFLKLTKGEQTETLLWQMFETELFLFPTQILKGFFKGLGFVTTKPLKAGYKALRPGFKFEGVENLASKLKPFFPEHHMVKGLKKAGFATDELNPIIDEGPRGLKHFFFSKMARKGDVSPALRKAVRWQRGGAHLDKKTKALIDTTKLRETHYRKEWNRVVAQRLTTDFSPKRANEIFDAQVRSTLGKEWVGKVTLKTANDYQMANFLRHAISHTKALDKAAKAGQYNKWMFDSVSPVRVVLGNWDKKFGTFKNVYTRVIDGLEKRNVYSFDRMCVLAEMFKTRGLGTWKVTGRGKMKFKPAFSKEEADQAFTIMQGVGNLRSLQKQVPMRAAKIEQQIKALTSGASDNVRRIIKTKNDFYDSLWTEHVNMKVASAFENAGLTARGRREVAVIERNLMKFLDEMYSTASQEPVSRRVLASKAIPRELRRPLVSEKGRHPWFQAEGAKLEEQLVALNKEFTPAREGGNFIGYLEDYVPRVARSRNIKYDKWDRALVGKMRSAYTKERKSPFAFDQITDLSRSFEGRIRAQGNEHFLYPAVEQAVNHVRKHPKKVREYVDHWIARALGRQSNIDEKVARVMRKIVPFGKKAWTEERVMHLARRMNDCAILGGLAFKPFSVMRNLFQPLLTIPAEMGGIQGFEHLLHGYRKAFDPTFRKWVRDNGMIQEFTPELYFTQRFLPWGTQAKWDQVRDIGLWAYAGADRMNRYVSAGAAVHRWEKALAATGVTKPGMWNHAKFMKKSGANAHYPWARDQIDDLVKAGNLREAELVHTKDVVANTQFLYRPAESPIISQKYGVVGKTGFLFQSWWANYGTLLEKWMRTGDAGAKANRMFTWMVSSAIGYSCMELLWGPRTAERSTFLGPFPATIDAFLVPATWGPVYHALNLIKTGMSPEVWAGDQKRLVSQAKALLRSSMVMFPGGLQLDVMAKAIKRGGIEALPASIIRYQRAKDFKPMVQRLAEKAGA